MCGAMIGVPHRPLLPSLPTGGLVVDGLGEEEDSKPGSGAATNQPEAGLYIRLIDVCITQP